VSCSRRGAHRDGYCRSGRARCGSHGRPRSDHPLHADVQDSHAELGLNAVVIAFAIPVACCRQPHPRSRRPRTCRHLRPAWAASNARTFRTCSTCTAKSSTRTADRAARSPGGAGSYGRPEPAVSQRRPDPAGHVPVIRSCAPAGAAVQVNATGLAKPAGRDDLRMAGCGGVANELGGAAVRSSCRRTTSARLGRSRSRTRSPGCANFLRCAT
jgi:hypothetical protein